MNYLIHNAIRDRHNRTLRAGSATHKGMKQFLFKEQARLVRGRPILLTEERFMANLDEIKSKAKAGLIYVTLGNMTPFDLEKMAPVVSQPRHVPPNFPLDSINRDQPAGVQMNRFGDKPPPEHFDIPVALPDAALDNPKFTAQPDKSDDEVKEVALPVLDVEHRSGEHKKKRR